MQHTILPKSKARSSGRIFIRRTTEPSKIRSSTRTVLHGARKGVAVRLFKISLELVVTLGLALPVCGQETTGTITGAVSDPSGAVVANAEITVINTGTSAS